MDGESFKELAKIYDVDGNDNGVVIVLLKNTP